MHNSTSTTQALLAPEAATIYRQAMEALHDAGIPFLVGGAYAYARYTHIHRHTKDFDVFIRRADLDAALAALRDGGFRPEITFPHWLAKAYRDEHFIDLIFRSANGLFAVDDAWFTRPREQEVLGMPVRLCPPEEIIASKAFVMERERYDGADVAHLLRCASEEIDWQRLLELLGPRWRVLLSHFILFGFVYPDERNAIPQVVLQELLGRLQAEEVPVNGRLCHGTLLSREQYLVDLEQWGYHDARLSPHGPLSEQDVRHWTAAIDAEEGDG